ncbi:glycosyltransferase family 2 protein [Blastococcus brunescens]|uniref:Glycosyltransferase n=1 Tax=Blastococcus brunescens TaxID=1564165 RepID=A0ABZ1B4P7_9ACTN|nr:glycosyltransferase [Blastococcus sp. BMG 8361]WRL64818.1 glycosyltransferase [Blastococcus sp. BMG 8361]
MLLVTSDSDVQLASALASIESQALEATVEVVVVDRAPDDGTPAVVEAWSRRVGVEARVLPREVDLAPGLELHRGLDACRGRYVALLDGGDEWLSVDKLQRQVQMLDGHPGLSMAATRTLVVDDATGGSRTVPAIEAELPEGGATAAHLADGRWPATASCVVYRSETLHRLDPGIFETAACRQLLDLAMTGYGPVGLVPDVATLHRVRSGRPGPDQGGSPVDARSLLPEHGHLLAPDVLRQLGAGTDLSGITPAPTRLAPPLRRGTPRRRAVPTRRQRTTQHPRHAGESSSSTTTSPPRGPASGSRSSTGC